MCIAIIKLKSVKFINIKSFMRSKFVDLKKSVNFLNDIISQKRLTQFTSAKNYLIPPTRCTQRTQETHTAVFSIFPMNQRLLPTNYSANSRSLRIEESISSS